MAGRTTSRWVRFYMDGYDMSGYGRSVGPLTWEFEEANLTAQMSDAIMGYLPNKVSMTCGTLNGVFDNTATSGLHVIGSSIQVERCVMIPIGSKAAPAQGDPAYCCQNVQLGYQANEDGGAVTATIPFGAWDGTEQFQYQKPWGWLLRPKTATTAVNAAVGIDDYGASTAKGGYMAYQVFTASAAGHLATIKVQHAATNADGNFADLGGCTTGSVDVGTAPLSGIIETTATTTTVNRYLRWQIVLTTATSVTFALAFVRNI